MLWGLRRVMSDNALLQCQEVSKQFPVKSGFLGKKRALTAVDTVSFSLGKGECLGLVGESGCGKSTLGRMACGLLAPSKGKVLLQGRELPLACAQSWAAGRLQMVFQDPFSSLNPRMTVAASVAEPLAARGVGRQERLQAADTMLSLVGLEGVGRRYPHEFSGGQRQRIAVARALMTRPDVIVCDEPVSALDASVQAQILNLLCDMQEQFSPAYLFISHDLNVVAFMCQRIMVMYLGRLLEDGPRDELVNHAAHPYTQALLSASLGERVTGAGSPLQGEQPSPLHPPKGCVFHPRCPRAEAICRKEVPEWRVLGENWRVRCHFSEGEA